MEKRSEGEERSALQRNSESLLPWHGGCQNSRLRRRLYRLTSFQRLQGEQGRGGTSQWSPPQPAIKASSNSDGSCGQQAPWHGVVNMRTSSPEPTNPSLILSRQINSSSGDSTKYLTSAPRNCQGIKNWESLRNYHSPEEAKETWRLNVMWSLDGVQG